LQRYNNFYLLQKKTLFFFAAIAFLQPYRKLPAVAVAALAAEQNKTDLPEHALHQHHRLIARGGFQPVTEFTRSYEPVEGVSK
jgi:hypothetical protein